MIVAKKKPIEEIIETVKNHNRILVAACNECVTVCEAGGKKEVAILASTLRMYFMNQGKDVKMDEVTLERQCDHEYLEEIRNVIDQYDAILSLPAAWGSSSWPRNISRPLSCRASTPASWGSRRSGASGRSGARGAASAFLPGPAGSVRFPGAPSGSSTDPAAGPPAGNCEIDKDVVCGWQLIVDRLKELGRLEDYEILAPIKDWSTERAGGPRKVVREDVRQ